MATTLWQKVTGPSAGLVQQHYVSARLDELKRRNPQLEQKIAKILTESPLLKHLKLKGDQWLEVYRTINRNLQAADLTINFKAESWFTKENLYPSYTQTYERSVGADGRKLLMDDPLNPGDVRARVDDAISLPTAWNAPAPPAHRGLRPGQQSGQRIAAQMAFGKQAKVTQPDGKKGVESQNPHFNPKTKQVFAALNYGRRPRGSTLAYGKSHLVLHPRLKVNALYYGGDTFFAPVQDTSIQMHYGMLAAVLAHSHTLLVDNIIKSCFLNMTLEDLDGFTAASLLLEGHIFGPLPFADNLSAVRLPASHMGTPIGINAFKFAAKHGAKLVYISD